ncbi:MAG: DUF441 domain-containing protein [Firmicutes bacterium]|nr:DUF441 domain-containing protein [Bacillota bacterium]
MIQNAFLLILLALGVLGGNHLVSISGTILLLLRLLGCQQWLPLLEGPCLQIGLTLLILSILIPFSSSDLELRQVAQALLRPTGAATFVAGIAGAYLGARGVTILQSHPEAILGIVLGTIVGATFFQGIPVGPLVAAGMGAVLLQLLRLLGLD